LPSCWSFRIPGSRTTLAGVDGRIHAGLPKTHADQDHHGTAEFTCPEGDHTSSRIASCRATGPRLNARNALMRASQEKRTGINHSRSSSMRPRRSRCTGSMSRLSNRSLAVAVAADIAIYLEDSLVRSQNDTKCPPDVRNSICAGGYRLPLPANCRVCGEFGYSCHDNGSRNYGWVFEFRFRHQCCGIRRRYCLSCGWASGIPLFQRDHHQPV
jgi:hypothetical protein